MLYSGETKRVVQKLPRPGPQVVYNLEVYAQHVYHVTQDGVLVHNTYEERAKEIHRAVRLRTQNRTTIAILDTEEGVRIVASSEPYLRGIQKEMLEANEIGARLTGRYHAEVRAVRYAMANNYTPKSIVASRPICKKCAEFLKQCEVTIEIHSSLK